MAKTISEHIAKLIKSLPITIEPYLPAKYGVNEKAANLHFHHEDGEVSTFHHVIQVCRVGSYLHGTATEHSDTDLKAVYISPLDDLIMGDDVATKKVSTSEDDVRNGAADVEIEFIELRKFMADLMGGQTYAIEMLSINSDNLLYSSKIWEGLLNDDTPVISKNVKPFIGYCVAQARKYGLKGERLAATEEVLKVLKTFDPKERLYNVIDQIPLNEYCERYTKDLSSSKDNVPNQQEMIRINDKEFNVEVRIDYMLPVIQSVVDRYGKRARKARDGVDKKAISHAFRVAYEARELLNTGEVTFPLREAEFLREIKTGEVGFNDGLRAKLTRLVDEVCTINSQVLPEALDTDYWREWILKIYKSFYTIT